MVGVREIELNQTYPSVPGSVPSARRAIVEFAADAGVSEQQLRDVYLAASEALTNVVKHAYQSQAGPICVTAALAGGELCVLVADDGCGFRAHANRGGLGLGLVLIASVCDELAIVTRASGGTAVAMRFKLDARATPDDQARGSVASATAPAASSFSTTT